MEKGIIKYGFFKNSLIIHLKNQAKFLEAISLKKYFRKIDKYTNVILYFENVNLIDSTFIGTLLFIGIENKKRNLHKGIIYGNEYIKDIVKKYALDKVYDVYTKIEKFEKIFFNTLNIEKPDEKEVLKDIIENHKLLSTFSEENRNEFENLLKILESEYEKKFSNNLKD